MKKTYLTLVLTCALGFLVSSSKLYAESLPVYDSVSSTQVLTINVDWNTLDYGRMFKAFDIAYALGANEITFSQPVTVMVGLIPVKAYAHITQFENSQSALWFEVFAPMRGYSDSRTLEQLTKGGK